MCRCAAARAPFVTECPKVRRSDPQGPLQCIKCFRAIALLCGVFEGVYLSRKLHIKHSSFKSEEGGGRELVVGYRLASAERITLMKNYSKSHFIMTKKKESPNFNGSRYG